MLCFRATLFRHLPCLTRSRPTHPIRLMATRSYKDAIDCLNSLQSNQAMIEAARASGGRLEKFAMHETEEYLKRIGYSVLIYIMLSKLYAFCV